MVNASTELKEGDRFENAFAGNTYILHQLPTKNWVLIRENDGRIWVNAGVGNDKPISAFQGYEEAFIPLQ